MCPHQCGIAPVETTLMLDDYLRRRVSANVSRSSTPIPPGPVAAQLSYPAADLRMPSLFEQRGIRFQRGLTGRVDPGGIAYSRRRAASSQVRLAHG